ncbi:MAG: dienelactone hydrolase family protein [Burkholderiaceae bacterium]|nr:dienelactone hydrolase family protein [Burkholderiaceae bacterium]
MQRQLWLELPPISTQAPRRLLVFLHGAGSTPETFAPVAIAWQLKFPGATAAIVEGLRPCASKVGRDWFDASGVSTDRAARIDAAGIELADRLRALQRDTSLAPAHTVVVGFSQGATVALALARQQPAPAAIVVSYAGQLARPIAPGERIAPTVHLLHGEFDSVVPTVHAERAFRGLRATGSDVTLDIVADESHSIGQAMINLGTARVLGTLFRGRQRPVCGRRALH